MVRLTSILEGLENIKPRMACAPMLNPGCDMTAISGKLTESPFSLRLYPGTKSTPVQPTA